MKKTSKRMAQIIFAMIALMITMSVVQADVIPLFPSITITMINQEPDPVAPGNTVEARFRIENGGANSAKDMEIKIVPNYPFSIYGTESEIKSIGTLAGAQTGDAGVKEKWKLLVDPDAVTGDNNIEVWYRIDQGKWTKTGDYSITVRSRDAVLAINQIKVDQDTIAPGTKTRVAFVLENMADNTLSDIKLNLGILTQVTTSTSVSYLELPFTPIGSGNEKTLKNLGAGKSEEVFFEIFTDADAESKVYKVPYSLSYSDSSGTNFTRTGIIGLLVNSNPELGINLEETDIYSAGAKGTVQIKLVNKGFSDIKFLDLRLGESEHYEILSNPEVYIGKLDSDDYDTAEYSLMVSKDAKDDIVLPLRIEYRDSNGHLFSEDISLPLKLYSGNELKQRTNDKSSSSWIFFLIIVVALAGFFIYRKMKKSKSRR